jgi:hypothetical protein
MWTRSLACCIALLTLVAAPVLGVVPPVAPPVLEAAPPVVLAAPGRPCSTTHWLALSTDPTVCPRVHGWDESRLFRPPNPEAPDLPFTGPLFCRYDRNSDPDPTPLGTVSGDAEVAGLHAAVPLCGVVLPLGTPAPALDPELLYRELHFQVGAMDLPLDPSKAPVRLAVVDTQPTGGFGVSAVPGQGSPHGFDIAAIARDLTCAKGCAGPSSKGGLCAAAITTRLALPLTSAGAEPSTSGGYLGRPSDVALAIVREVDDWLAADWQKPGKPQHLILNLSIGWDPDLLHKQAQQMGGSAQNAEELAVYAALDYARAQGALPIAASGNSPGGSQPGQGATAPARWYAVPPETGGAMTAVHDPVVWAVGAVDRDDRPLANVRANSLPPLVAYGDHAVVPLPVPLPSGANWTDPLTGSSVSAVVASSIATVAWHLRSELPAEEIMMLLARSARELPRHADLDRPGSILLRQVVSSNIGGGIVGPPSIRRLWFHSALSRAWSREKLYVTESSWAANVSPTMSCGAAHPFAACGPTTWICPGTAWSSSLSCPPSLPSIASVPWVLPQPSQDPCPTCSISSGSPPAGGIIHPTGESHGQMRLAQTGATQAGAVQASQQPWQIEIAIPASWTAGTTNCFTSLVLEAAVGKLVIVPPGGKICASQSLLVTDLPFDPGQGTATITFRIEGTSNSVWSPLYVGWQP